MNRRRIIMDSSDEDSHGEDLLSEDDDELHSAKSSFCTSTPNRSQRPGSTGLEESIINMTVDEEDDKSSPRGSNSRSASDSTRSSASRSNPSASSPSDADRSRSFHDIEREVEMSPISQRLAESNDPRASQKLRERLLRKNHLQNKGGQDVSPKEDKSKARKKSTLLTSSLSPIAPKPIVSASLSNEAVAADLKTLQETSPNQMMLSPEPSSQPKVTELSDAELRGELVARGFNCGPVMGTARKVYEKKLQTLRDGDTKLSKPVSSRSPMKDATNEMPANEPAKPQESAARKKLNLDDLFDSSSPAIDRIASLRTDSVESMQSASSLKSLNITTNDKKFITPRKTAVQQMQSDDEEDEKEEVDDEASFLELSDDGDGDAALPASQKTRTLADAIASLEKKQGIAAAASQDMGAPLDLSDVDVNDEDEEQELEDDDDANDDVFGDVAGDSNAELVIESSDASKERSTTPEDVQIMSSDGGRTADKSSIIVLSSDEEKRSRNDGAVDVADKKLPTSPNALGRSPLQSSSDVRMQSPKVTKPSTSSTSSYGGIESLQIEPTEALQSRLDKLLNLQRTIDIRKLPDKGERMQAQITDILDILEIRKVEEALTPEPTSSDKKFIDRGYPEVSDVRKPTKDDGSQRKKREEEDDKPTTSKPRAAPVLVSTDVNPEIYNRMFAHDQKKLYAGKMTDKREAQVYRMNDQALKSFHDALNSIPDESTVVESPKGLKVELMHHQQQGLAWMLWREAMNPPSGILADDMGLGKTLSMISLILHQKNERHKRREEGNDECDKKRRQIAKENGLIPSNATLIVAPASLIFQWEAEVDRRVKPERLSVNMFHGPKNKREQSAKRLARFDIVITTYTLLANELTERVINGEDDDDSDDNDSDDSTKNMKVKGKKRLRGKDDSPLAQIAWARVVLDEAHQIKNKTTAASKAASRVPGYARWCLTGTPIHNNLWDLYSLIRFMRVVPFSEEKHWKEYIMTGSGRSADRLNMMVKNLLLRRTKTQVSSITQKPLVDLKPKTVHKHILELEGLERAVYDIMMEAAKVRIKKMLEEADENKQDQIFGYRRRPKKTVSSEKIINPFITGPRVIDSNARQFDQMACMLVMLLRLRQACVHFTLTKNAVDMDSLACLGADGEMKDETDVLQANMANVSLDESIGADLVNEAAEIFEPDYKSAKLKKIIEIIDTVIAADDKVVIVSQWTSMLELVEAHLKRIPRLRYTAINGKVPVADRQSRVDSFNETDGGASVMLLSLTAGGVGLNLVGGNHLVMCDLHWNPALEAQACDRIYRMGQKKDVQIHRLIVADTIEQKVSMLQESKLELAGKVLEGAASRKMNKLTMADLKFLFDLSDRDKPNKSKDRTASTSSSSTIPPQQPSMPDIVQLSD